MSSQEPPASGTGRAAVRPVPPESRASGPPGQKGPRRQPPARTGNRTVPFRSDGSVPSGPASSPGGSVPEDPAPHRSCHSGTGRKMDSSRRIRWAHKSRKLPRQQPTMPQNSPGRYDIIYSVIAIFSLLSLDTGPQLDGFPQMEGCDFPAAGQIRDGPGHFDDPVMAPGAEPQADEIFFQQGFPPAESGGQKAFHFPPSHAGVAEKDGVPFQPFPAGSAGPPPPAAGSPLNFLLFPLFISWYWSRGTWIWISIRSNSGPEIFF